MSARTAAPTRCPRWGRVAGGSLLLRRRPTTRHTRNVEANPAVTLTLESGTDVVIVEGESHATRADPDGLGAQLAAAFTKYADAGYQPGPDSWAGTDGGGLRVITPPPWCWPGPTSPTDCTRFRFAG